MTNKILLKCPWTQHNWCVIDWNNFICKSYATENNLIQIPQPFVIENLNYEETARHTSIEDFTYINIEIQ